MKNLVKLFILAKPYWPLLFLAWISLLMITALNLLTPWLIRDLISILEKGLDPSLMSYIMRIALILGAVYIARIIFRYFNNYMSHKAAWNLVADMRVKIYGHLQKLSLRYYHDKQTGQLMSRTTNDTATFESLIAHSIPDITTNILIIAGVTIILFFMNTYLALAALIPVPLLLFGGWLFARKIRPNFREAQKTLAELNATLQDNISGMREIQVFNQQPTEKSRIHKSAHSYSSAVLRALRMSAVFHPTVEAVSSSGTVIVVAFGGWLALKGSISISDIVGFLLYLNMFYQPITTLARVTEDLQMAVAGAERVFEVLETEPDIIDSENAADIPKAEGKLEFRNVDFHYVPSNPVLKDVSFSADPGQMIALVGPTGVGKTTVVSLAARFYDPVGGSVLLDGKDLKDITLTSLRNQISIVLQDVFLFNGTVAENIAYGSKTATKEEIVEAAKIAGADDFILDMPESYDTVIGERGVKLSGGQKQRLSIARAVLRDTPILILDEATSSVDVETEAKIQQAINRLAGSRTIIVIAHRLSTVKKADKILVISEGKIIQEGDHEKLMKEEGLYRELCMVQLQN